MKRKIFPLIIIAVIVLTAVFVTACESNVHIVSFYVDGELYESFTVKDGGYIEEIPSVPQKEGKSGNWSITDLDEIHSDLKISAIYTDATYKITFIADGAVLKEIEVRKNSKLTDVPAVPEKKGYIGSWNVSDFSNVDKSLNVYAEYKRVDAVVTFLHEGSVVSEAHVAMGGNLKNIPEVPQILGKNLSGRWVLEGTNDLADFTKINGDMRVCSDYFVTVELVIDGETKKAECQLNEQTESFDGGEKEGYDFGGWYLEEDFRTEVVFPCVFENNTTLYCRWYNNIFDEGFSFEDGKVTGYNGEKTEITVPYKYSDGEDTVFVTGIADNAFADNYSLQKVTLPSTLKEIGAGAFKNCFNLLSVEYSDECFVEKIGADAFNCCAKLKSFEFSPYLNSLGKRAFAGCTAMQNYIGLGNTVLTEIPDRAFYLNSNSQEFVIPDTVVDIGESAFEENVLAKFVFSRNNSIEKVGERAFYGCASLAEFIAPNVKEIGAEGFGGCRSLIYLSLPASQKATSVFSAEEGNYYYDVDGYSVPLSLYGIFVSAGKDGEIVEGAYKNLSSVKKVELGSGVRKIGNFAFTSDKGVFGEKFVLTLSNTLVQIGEYAFVGRNDLVSLELPISVERIGERAFYGLDNLTKVTVGLNNALSYVGKEAFSDTPWYDNTRGVVVLGRVALGITEDYLLSIGSTTITADMFSGISIIAPYAFAGNGLLRSVIVADSVYRIYDHAFADCAKLKEVVIGSSTNLGYTEVIDGEETVVNEILVGCSALEKLTIGLDSKLAELFGTEEADGCYLFNGSYLPLSLKELTLLAGNTVTVRKGIFDGLYGVERVILGEGIVAVNDGAFLNCRLKEIYFPSTVTEIGNKVDEEEQENAGEENEEETVEENVIVYEGVFPSTLEKAVFAENSRLTTIYERAFAETSLTEIFIPNTVEKIGKYAFADGLEGIASLTFADGETELVIDDHAFDGVRYIGTDFVLTLPSRLVSLGESAFANGKGLTGVIFGDKITTIGKEAFKNSDLKSFDLPETVVCFDEEWNTLVNDILENTLVTELTLRTPITAETLLGSSAHTLAKVNFYGDIAENALNGLSVKNVVVADAEKIGAYAFYGCIYLTRIILPSTVTEIGDYAFGECAELVTFSIESENLERVGDYAFVNDKKLRSVFLPTTVKNTAYIGVFSGCENLQNISVLPATLKEIGDDTFKNCYKLTTVVIPVLVEKIGKDAFYGCASMELQNIKFDELTEIGENAFFGCAMLSGIKAENLVSVGNEAFYGCTSLEEITVVSGLADIVDYKESIVTVNLSANMTAIDDNIFDGCTKLSNVTVHINNDGINEILQKLTVQSGCRIFVTAEGYKKIEAETKELLNGVLFTNPTEINAVFEYDNINMTAKLLSVGDFDGEVIYFPSCAYKDEEEYTVVELGNGVLENSVVKHVVIPYCIERIGTGAFRNSEIATVMFETGSRLLSIGEEAFRCCANLKTITLPDNLKEIKNRAFYQSGLTQLYVSTFGDLETIGEYAFYGCAELETAVIATSSLSDIGSYAFANCGLVSVTINKSAKISVVKANVFKNCYLLKEENVILPDGITVDEDAFAMD